MGESRCTMGVELPMANKQRGPLPPVLSPEETRVRPPEEDEAELPPEEPSWDPQRDETMMHPNAAPVTDEAEMEVDDATPPVPRKIVPVPIEDLPEQALDDPTISLMPKVTTDGGMQAPQDAVDDSTRQIPRKSTVRPPPQAEDDSTRQIPRKSSIRPALQDSDDPKAEDDPTRQIPRKSSIRPSLQDPDPTRPIPRKTGQRPALQDAPPPVRNPARKSGAMPPVARPAPAQEPPLPWEAGSNEDDLSRLPTRAQPLPPAAPASPQSLVYPPDGPPVLVPVNTEPHFLAQAPKVSSPVFTQPNYVPPPPPVVSPIVTAPHLTTLPPAAAPPPETDLRTTFSNKAAMVADLVKATFARRSYGMAPYRLRIDEPDGPSTAGGLHARQPISLVANMDSAPPIVVGWVDVAKKDAQLRTYDVVKRRHQSRFTTPLDLTANEYEEFLNELVETLFYGGIKIMLQVPDDEPSPGQGVQSPAQGQGQVQVQAQPQTSGRGCLGTLFILGVTFATGVAVGSFSDFFAILSERVLGLFSGH
jgi:hypothetical protein